MVSSMFRYVSEALVICKNCGNVMCATSNGGGYNEEYEIHECTNPNCESICILHKNGQEDWD